MCKKRFTGRNAFARLNRAWQLAVQDDAAAAAAACDGGHPACPGACSLNCRARTRSGVSLDPPHRSAGARCAARHVGALKEAPAPLRAMSEPCLLTKVAQRGTGAAAVNGVCSLSKKSVRWQPNDPSQGQPALVDIAAITSEREPRWRLCSHPAAAAACRRWARVADFQALPPFPSGSMHAPKRLLSSPTHRLQRSSKPPASRLSSWTPPRARWCSALSL